MANTKISQLTPNTNPSGGEELVYAYNGTNGKMTLNTMKGYVENNLYGYVTDADLTTGLAGKQDTLVSGTNIKTINGSSILGSGNLVVSGGGGSGEDNDYDAVVDASGNGDYTSISDAITAGIKRMYVRNGNYSMSSQTLSTGDFKLVGESKQGVHIDIIYPTRSGTIFTMTSNTTDLTHSFLISNVTFNITYTGEYGYFILFDIPDNGVLTINDCNICVISAENGCNFYLCDTSGGGMSVNGSYIEVYPVTGNPQGVGFLGGADYMTVRNSTIVVDMAISLGTTGVQFNGNCGGMYEGCIFKIGVTHNTAGDIAVIGASHADSCTYKASSKANFRIYGENVNCKFPTIGDGANYDTTLATAVANNNITIWKPNTAYTVGQYVQNGNLLTIARCTTAHTSGDTFDNSKWEPIYGDIYIGGDLNDCSLHIKGIAVISGIGQYSTAFTLPSTMGTISECVIIVDKNTSLTTNGVVILGYRGFTNSRIEANYNYKGGIKVLLPSECSMFSNNRLISYTGSIYSSGKANMITNNIWTYVTGQTAPTATQVTGGGSTIDNNIFYDVADWDS